ncbi:hypothetical protein ACFSJW_15590 [Flavobacterium artemisiae]|uniref:Uncharacterized protein n=1 Tax=Flavobacterium artemisiae TaxID=2126556 RepID=A0ABW4H840_9FLAO
MHLKDNRNVKKIERKKFKNKEKKLQRIHYSLLIMAMISFVVNYMFLRNSTIGHDIRYVIYIFCVPVIIGVLFFGIYRREFLIKTYLSFNKTFEKLYVIGFFLLQGVLISYLSFGQIAWITWSYLNKKESEKNKIEIINCNITGFYLKKNPDISFKFNNRTEVLSVTTEMNRENYNRNRKDYKVEITVQKGIWNYYVVKKWELKKKNL